jgi:hypothetical protein
MKRVSLADFQVVEFGVVLEQEGIEHYYLVPVEKAVQAALREMATATLSAMHEISDAPELYEPAEKYGTSEHLYMPLEDPLAENLQYIYAATNIPISSAALHDPAAISAYFARFQSATGEKILGVRKANQFKGVLKSRLLTLVTDQLKMVEDTVFKLDAVFDLIVERDTVRVLHPTAFEYIAELQEAIKAAAPDNVKALSKDLPFVEFSTVEAYALKHPRAARHLASIRSEKETKNIDKAALKRHCKANGIIIAEKQGKLHVDDADVMGFLEVLDRRRYRLELVRNTPEFFKAGSRKKLSPPTKLFSFD